MLVRIKKTEDGRHGQAVDNESEGRRKKEERKQEHRCIIAISHRYVLVIGELMYK